MCCCCNDLIQTIIKEPDFLKKVILEMNRGCVAMIQKGRPSPPNESGLVLHAWGRRGKVATRSRPCGLCFLIGKVLSITCKPFQAKQLMSTTSMFFMGWEMQFNETGCGYGQLVIGSFIRKTCSLIHHVSSRHFCETSNHPGYLRPLTAQVWHLVTSGFFQN